MQLRLFLSKAAVILALLMLSAGYGFAGGQEQSNQQPTQASSSQENSSATAAANDKWQEGTACVKNNAPDCPSQYRGVCRSARANGCSHDSCTTAKNQARANLRAAVPQACHKYIESTAPCLKGPKC